MKDLTTFLLVLGAFALALYLLQRYNRNSAVPNQGTVSLDQPSAVEQMSPLDNMAVSQDPRTTDGTTNVPSAMSGSDGLVGQGLQDEMNAGVSQEAQQLRQASCFPKEQLLPEELLPQDNSSLWAQVNPAGAGSLKDKNFLQSGHHIGINTVGQTLRNANLQLRSEPPCPQVVVSPFLQTTIEPDLNRIPLELGGCR